MIVMLLSSFSKHHFIIQTEKTLVIMQNDNIWDSSNTFYKKKQIAEQILILLDLIAFNKLQFGRYQNPEELPFFPQFAHLQAAPPFRFPQVLDPRASSVNVSRTIWEIYFSNLLQLITSKGDDGNYQQAAAADLICLQALSKRIHYGRFVAEVKFRGSPSDFTTAIQAKDSGTLTELVTSRTVEEKVVERVTKKAEVFGQTVTTEEDASGVTKDGNATEEYKVDPSVVSKLYSEWVIPLTKQVEVDYLLRRLD